MEYVFVTLEELSGRSPYQQGPSSLLPHVHLLAHVNLQKKKLLHLISVLLQRVG